jgi:hypothetical protein
MKLKELAIEGYADATRYAGANPPNNFSSTNFSKIKLGQFSGGLNFVYGEAGTGKTTLRQRVRDALFGSHSVNTELTTNTKIGDCTLTFTDGVNQLQANTTSTTLSEFNKCDPDYFDSVFSVGFRDPSQSVSRLANTLRQRLGVPTGSQAAGDESLYLKHQHEQETRRKRLETLRQEVSSLQAERQGLQTEIDAEKIQTQSKAVELDRQISALHQRIGELENQQRSKHQIELEIAHAEREAALLRDQIQNMGVTYIQTHTPVAAPAVVEQPADVTQLYSRLDEIERQIHRWRKIQSEIQAQRVRLKDEMLAWKQLTIDSVDHPYHNARQILLELEKRVDRAEHQAQPWLQTHGPEDAEQAAHFVSDACKATRDDLNRLCHELSEPYTQIRHKYAASELKQLRHYYNEMGDNIEDLLRRRSATIQEIGAVDPQGADAVVRADKEFSKLAIQEGNYAARCRFVGNVPTKNVPVTRAVEPTYQAVPADTTVQRQSLAVLESRITSLRGTYSSGHVETEPLRLQLAELTRQRSLIGSALETQYRVRLDQLNIDVQNRETEIRSLSLLIEQNQNFVVTPPNRILVESAEYLNRLTGGELTKVWLEPSTDLTGAGLAGSNGIQVRDRFGKVLNFSAVEPDLQTLTLLSIVLAAKQSLHEQQVDLPLWLDDLFASLEKSRVNPTLDLLADFCRDNVHQVIVLTQHKFLADRMPGLPSFELAPRPFGPLSYPAPEPTRPASVPRVKPWRSALPENVAVASPTAPIVVNSPKVLRPDDFASATLTVSSQIPVAPVLRTYAEPVVQPIQAATAPKKDWGLERAAAYPQSVSSRKYPLSKYKSSFDRQETSTLETDSVYQSQAAQVGRTNPRVASVSVNEVGDRLGQAVSTTEMTLIESVNFFDSAQLRVLNQRQIETVGDFLDLEPTTASSDFDSVSLTADTISKIQEAMGLLCVVANLQSLEAQLLVASGITESTHLATSNSKKLFERLERFLRSPEGRPFANSQRTLSIGLVEQWQRSAQAFRNRSGGAGSGERRSRTRRSENHRSDRQPQFRTYPYPESESRQEPDRENYQSRSNGRTRSRYDRTRDSNTNENHQRDQRDQRGFAPRPARMDFARRTEDKNVPRVVPQPLAPASVTALASRASGASSSKRRSTKKAKPRASRRVGHQSPTGNLKFYLELTDHIEAAPSIGTKTAQRFEKIGVFTIADFLKQTAESLSQKLNYKRMSANVVRQWQHQARLVCRVPNLRGHDAQLLVACDIVDPEELATMQPTKLFDIIGPFSETSAGLKIIRNGKQPDLAEITDWIDFAQNTRSIQAA